MTNERKMINNFDVCYYLGLKYNPYQSDDISFEDISECGIVPLNGCYVCGACIAVWNSCPMRNGYVACEGCVGNYGYETIEEYLGFHTCEDSENNFQNDFSDVDLFDFKYNKKDADKIFEICDILDESGQIRSIEHDSNDELKITIYAKLIFNEDNYEYELPHSFKECKKKCQELGITLIVM